MQVRQRETSRHPEMPATFDLSSSTACQRDRQIPGRVRIAIAHARAVNDDRVVQKCAIAVGSGLHLLHEAGEQFHVMRVDLCQPREQVGPHLVVRYRVMRLWDADLGIGANAFFTADQERADASQIGLIGNQHEVEHDVGVFFEVSGNTSRLGDHRQVTISLTLGNLDSPLDVAHGIQVAVQLASIAAADHAPERSQLVAHRIEHALVFAEAAQPRLSFGAPSGANKRSKTARGSVSIGSGVFASFHAKVAL